MVGFQQYDFLEKVKCEKDSGCQELRRVKGR